ncbi:hypothetical protein [Streptomyces sp. NBC_00690]|uniref:hypothetical protein n=1 Tax=Streptomyces sp. NBC_00690 TaxID=2975808 RepID=UPI002E29496C|nr:hypothetical protein [Streptomyces sp. NBC_00690]
MTRRKGIARSCSMCRGWSVLAARACSGCEKFARAHPVRGACPRCRHDAHLGSDGLCKPCVQAIRAEGDAEWALGIQGAGPRALQLTVGTHRHYATQANPLVLSQSGGPGVSAGWKRKLNRQRAVERDQSAVLEPQMWGQLPLFILPRTLTRDTARAIATRQLSGWEKAESALLVLTAERRMSKAWRCQAAEMVRLALAIREADGAELTCELLLRELPKSGDVVCIVLLHAGLLVSESVPDLRLASRSCGDCNAWMPEIPHAGFRCDPCRDWRMSRHRQPGQCTRCGRDGLALSAGHCRACHPYRDDDRSRPAATQLLIDLPVGPGGTSLLPQDDGPLLAALDVMQAATICAGQEALFTLRRDWSPVLARLRGRPLADLPLTKAVTALLDDFAEQRRDQEGSGFNKNIRTLTILGYWLGGENAFHERDVHDLAHLDTHLAAKPVCQFLRARDLLVDDPALHRDRDLAGIEKVLATLPQPVAEEVDAWVQTLRGQGPRENEPRSWEGIRRYLTTLRPTLTAWTATGMTTLREVTADHIQDTMNGLEGTGRRQRATALRSLFRTLKRERLVFRDLARHLPVGDLTGIPRPVPSDVLASLLDQASTPFAQLAIALAAIHAVPSAEIRTALTADLNLARGTLQLRRGLRRHTLYLEPLTHRLAADWLTYRHQRWPTSANPHLLVTQKTAPDPDYPAVHRSTMQTVLPKGQTLDGLRRDRILNEAFTTGDPLTLMRLFGITEATAMRYVTAAYPERTAKLPR